MIMKTKEGKIIEILFKDEHILVYVMMGGSGL